MATAKSRTKKSAKKSVRPKTARPAPPEGEAPDDAAAEAAPKRRASARPKRAAKTAEGGDGEKGGRGKRAAAPRAQKDVDATGKSLVIVESPAKSRTLNKFLGRDFAVMASYGHVMDLPKSKLGVDLENDFEPQYEPIAARASTLQKLKAAARTAQRVLLALRQRGDLAPRQFERVLDCLAGLGVRPVDVDLAREVATEVALRDEHDTPLFTHGDREISH